MSNLSPVIKSLASTLASTDTHVRIRSQITPEITFHLASLLDENVSKDKTLMRLLRPTYIIEGLGTREVIAPYGQALDYRITLVSIIAAGLASGFVTAKLGYLICKLVK